VAGVVWEFLWTCRVDEKPIVKLFWWPSFHTSALSLFLNLVPTTHFPLQVYSDANPSFRLENSFQNEIISCWSLVFFFAHVTSIRRVKSFKRRRVIQFWWHFLTFPLQNMMHLYFHTRPRTIDRMNFYFMLTLGSVDCEFRACSIQLSNNNHVRTNYFSSSQIGIYR